jgi:cytoskeletal protein RodZ
MPGLGDEFRAAREARHLSLSDVSEQIHIRSVYLQSIEDEDWTAIAAPVYVRGFVRTYARFLGLDPEAAVERLGATLAGDAGPRAHEAAGKPIVRTRNRTSRSPSPWLWTAIVVAILLVAFVGYRAFERSSDMGGDAVAAASPAPTDPAPAASPMHHDATPKPAAPVRTLVVSVTQTSWLLVKVDGSQMVEGIYPAGTIKSFHGKSASIRAGNAGGVDLTVNGKHIGALGALGAVVDKTFQLAEE